MMLSLRMDSDDDNDRNISAVEAASGAGVPQCPANLKAPQCELTQKHVLQMLYSGSGF